MFSRLENRTEIVRKKYNIGKHGKTLWIKPRKDGGSFSRGCFREFSQKQLNTVKETEIVRKKAGEICSF